MLTQPQLTALKAAILAEANVTADRTAGNYGPVAAYFNASAGAGFVWKPSLSVGDFAKAIDWAEYAALSGPKQNTYLALVAGGSIDATDANTRGAFAAIFATSPNSSAAMTALAKKVPTRIEALFATTNVTPLYGHTVSDTDVADALTKG